MKNSAGCIVHCRVSSSKQAREGESLEVQKRISLSIVERSGWQLAHAPWLEALSGRKARPVFEEVLKFIDRNPGKVTYYLCWSIERFTRGGSEAYAYMKREVSKRGVQLIDCQGVIQPTRNTLDGLGFEYDWSLQSPSKLAETVLADVANIEVTTILTRLIGQEIRLAQLGFKVRRPDDGFINKRIYVDGKKRTIQVPSATRASFYISMFEMRASRQHTDQEICDILNAQGYRSRTRQRWDRQSQTVIGETAGIPLTPQRLQEIIKRPVYAGVVCEKWTNGKPVRAPYQGLVSIKTFNAANRGARVILESANGLELLHDLGHGRAGRILQKDNPLFPYRRVVLCPTCRKPFMGSSSRSRSGKRVPAYHCDRNHPRVALNKRLFEETVRGYVDHLSFSPPLVGALEAVVMDAYDDWRSAAPDAAAVIEQTAAALETERANVVRSFKAATSPAMHAALEEDMLRIEGELRSASGERQKLAAQESDLRAYLANMRSIMEHPAQLLNEQAGTPYLEQNYRLVFGDLPTLHELKDGTAKLSPICWAFQGQTEAKSALVRLKGLDWNTFIKGITQGHRPGP